LDPDVLVTLLGKLSPDSSSFEFVTPPLGWLACHLLTPGDADEAAEEAGHVG
jgi:hypothetical protein